MRCSQKGSAELVVLSDGRRQCGDCLPFTFSSVRSRISLDGSATCLLRVACTASARRDLRAREEWAEDPLGLLLDAATAGTADARGWLEGGLATEVLAAEKGCRIALRSMSRDGVTQVGPCGLTPYTAEGSPELTLNSNER